MSKIKKNNVLNFPEKLSSGDREVEAIVFAAAEPLVVLCGAVWWLRPRTSSRFVRRTSATQASKGKGGLHRKHSECFAHRAFRRVEACNTS